MGNKKNRKAEQAEQEVARDAHGRPVTIPLCVKTSTPKHTDFLIPMPPPKNYRWYPHQDFSMERTNLVREPPSCSDEPLVFLYDQSPLTGLRDDADVVAARLRVEELMAEQEGAVQTVTSEQDLAGENLEGTEEEKMKARWLSPAMLYDVEEQEEDSPVFVSEIMPGFPGLRFYQMTPDEAREAPNHTPTVWVAPAKFTLQKKSSLCWTLMMFNKVQFRIFGPLGLKKGERRQILESAFWLASHKGGNESVNALYLLFSCARDAAIKNHNEELFAEALVNYIAAVRQLALPTLALDLMMWGQECGRAFEAASLYPAHSAEKRQALRHKAVLAFKQAVSDSMRSAVLNPEDVCQGWNFLAQALFRAGDLSMAVRAYHWGLHVSTGLEEEGQTSRPPQWRIMMDNLVLLGKLLKQTPEEQEQVRTEGLQRILRGESKTLPGIQHNGQCQSCGAVSANLKCSVCKRVYYCSAQCQKQDWKQHKALCKPQGAAGA